MRFNGKTCRDTVTRRHEICTRSTAMYARLNRDNHTVGLDYKPRRIANDICGKARTCLQRPGFIGGAVCARELQLELMMYIVGGCLTRLLLATEYFIEI